VYASGNYLCVLSNFFLAVTSLTTTSQEEHPDDGALVYNKTPPNQRLIALLPSAHGVHDVNTVSWCPRTGLEDFLATTGDDGVTRVWRMKSTVVRR